MLNYKTIFGDLLVFKEVNGVKATMTISRSGLGIPLIDRIEYNGKEIEFDEIDDDLDNYPFTREEIAYFKLNYSNIVGPKY